MSERQISSSRCRPRTRPISQPPGSRSNYWLNALVLTDDDLELRDAILERTNAEGLGTRPAWRPLHQLPMYEPCPRMGLEVVESLYRRLVNIPSSPTLVPANGGAGDG